MEIKKWLVIKYVINNKLNLAPGPGQYQAFSEFGIYRSKNADKFEEEVNKRTGTMTDLK